MFILYVKLQSGNKDGWLFIYNALFLKPSQITDKGRFRWNVWLKLKIYNETFSSSTKNAHYTQPAFTCSKLIIEALKQDVKYVQSQQ